MNMREALHAVYEDLVAGGRYIGFKTSNGWNDFKKCGVCWVMGVIGEIGQDCI